MAVLMVTIACCSVVARGEAPTAVASTTATSGERVDFKAAIAPLLEKYCTDCHGRDNPKGNLSLEFANEKDAKRRLLEDPKQFEHMADRVRSGEMPPKKKAQPGEREKEVLFRWIDQELIAGLGPKAFGHVARVRRLTWSDRRSVRLAPSL